MSMYIEITDMETHDKVTKNSKVCVLDFYADWCGPCKRLAPLLQDAVLKDSDLCSNVSTGEDDIEGKIVFAKINIDNFQDLANVYKVRSIPQISFYKNGELHSKVIIGPKVQEILETVNELID